MMQRREERAMTQYHSIGELEIVTASWFTQLPSDTVRVGISRGAPRRQSGYRMLRSLAPGQWWNSVDELEYVVRFVEKLARIDPLDIHFRLSELAGSKNRVALLCFERPLPGNWCHRAMVASWLSATLDLAVPEYGFEAVAQHDHPLLPPSLAGADLSGED